MFTEGQILFVRIDYHDDSGLHNFNKNDEVIYLGYCEGYSDLACVNKINNKDQVLLIPEANLSKEKI